MSENQQRNENGGQPRQGSVLPARKRKEKENHKWRKKKGVQMME